MYLPAQGGASGKSTESILIDSTSNVGFALGTLVIPADEILEVEIRLPSIIGDLFRGKSFAYSFPLKIDTADMHRHVALRKKSGFMKYLRFTPDDPDRFVELGKTIMKS